ncbi:hypothetical protein PS15m_010046 [Mucor circinelloides]
MEPSTENQHQHQQQQHHKNGPFPPELLLSIFAYLDGTTLTSCSQVCRQWAQVIAHYDELIWPNACHRDFERASARRWWSLQFPAPKAHKNQRTWQDMYRITRNWYNGHCVKGFYPNVSDATSMRALPCTVIGAPQEQGMFTSLTIANDGRIVRSNPNYHGPSGSQSLIIQSPQTKQRFFLDNTAATSEIPGWPEAARSHSIVCHYTQSNSKWLVTGGLNGTVAVWNLETKALVRMWQGHRGRVLCISMNDDVVVSGGSDSMIRVWDLDKSSSNSNTEWTNHHRPTRRGMIDISSYLSGRSDWYQGVGEIAANGHLVACAPDASGPILVFSLLTGSLVYELRVPEETVQTSEWVTEDITAFTRLCLTPFFLLTKGKVSNDNNIIKLVPSLDNIVQQRRQKKKSVGYVKKLSDSVEETDSPAPPVAQMTPYQLYQYYQSINKTGRSNAEEEQAMPSTSVCINVWDLQTGKIAYRLLPTLEKPYQNYTITDVRLTPDYSKVFASIEVRGQKHYEERLYCWDFSLKYKDQPQESFDIIELDNLDPALRKTGKSWVCYM